MNKYALIGKNISHSRSPEMYKKLISPTVDYQLLDYQSASDIPKALDLLSVYAGINITSPYKKHFLNEVELTDSGKKTGAINCLKKSGDKIIGTNTDYLAILDILKKYKNLDVIVLGDGVMSNVAQVACLDLNIPFKVMSRKITAGFDQLNLEDEFKIAGKTPFIINTCSRNYIFSGKLPKTSIFWDFNYNFTEHSSLLTSKVDQYIDGLEMLERQAFYAVAFWSEN